MDGLCVLGWTIAILASTIVFAQALPAWRNRHQHDWTITHVDVRHWDKPQWRAYDAVGNQSWFNEETQIYERCRYPCTATRIRVVNGKWSKEQLESL